MTDKDSDDEDFAKGAKEEESKVATVKNKPIKKPKVKSKSGKPFKKPTLISKMAKKNAWMSSESEVQNNSWMNMSSDSEDCSRDSGPAGNSWETGSKKSDMMSIASSSSSSPQKSPFNLLQKHI